MYSHKMYAQPEQHLLPHANHDALVPWPANYRRKERSRSIISSESCLHMYNRLLIADRCVVNDRMLMTCLHHARAVVADDSGDLAFITHNPLVHCLTSCNSYQM